MPEIVITEKKKQDHADGTDQKEVKCVEVDFKRVGVQVILNYALPDIPEVRNAPNIDAAIDAGDLSIKSTIKSTTRYKYQSGKQLMFTDTKVEYWKIGQGYASIKDDKITAAEDFGYKPSDVCSILKATSVELRVVLAGLKGGQGLNPFAISSYAFQQNDPYSDPNNPTPIDGVAISPARNTSSENGRVVPGDKWDLVDGVDPSKIVEPDWGPLNSAIRRMFPSKTKKFSVENDHCGKPTLIFSIYIGPMPIPDGFDWAAFKRYHNLPSGGSPPKGGNSPPTKGGDLKDGDHRDGVWWGGMRSVMDTGQEMKPVTVGQDTHVALPVGTRPGDGSLAPVVDPITVPPTASAVAVSPAEGVSHNVEPDPTRGDGGVRG